MYATPKDAGTYDFNEAAKYAKNSTLTAKDFRVPTKGELNVLYQNRDKGKLKGTFNETGSFPPGGTGRPRRPTPCVGPALQRREPEHRLQGPQFVPALCRVSPLRPEMNHSII